MTIKNYFCIIMISDESVVVRNYGHIKAKEENLIKHVENTQNS